MQRFFLDPARRLRLAICSLGKALASQTSTSLRFVQDDADGMLVTDEGEQAMIALTETTLQGRPMVACRVPQRLFCKQRGYLQQIAGCGRALLAPTVLCEAARLVGETTHPSLHLACASCERHPPSQGRDYCNFCFQQRTECLINLKLKHKAFHRLLPRSNNVRSPSPMRVVLAARARRHTALRWSREGGF